MPLSLAHDKGCVLVVCNACLNAGYCGGLGTCSGCGVATRPTVAFASDHLMMCNCALAVVRRPTALREIAEVQRDYLSAADTRRGDIWRSMALMEVAEVQRDYTVSGWLEAGVWLAVSDQLKYGAQRR